MVDAWVATVRGIQGPIMDRLEHLILEAASWDRFGDNKWDEIAPWPALFRELELRIPCIELQEGGLAYIGQQSPQFRVLFRMDDSNEYSRIEAQIGVPAGTITNKPSLDFKISKFAAMLGTIRQELTELRVTFLKKPKFELCLVPFEELAQSCPRLESFTTPS